MKKILFVLGLGGLGYAIYNYVNKQLYLAISWDYEISNFKPKQIYEDRITATLDLEILNKSSFALTVNSYDILVFYKDALIGETKSNDKLEILGDATFNIPIIGDIYYNTIVGSSSSLGTLILKKRPLAFDVKGVVDITFMGINRIIKVNKKELEATNDLSALLGLTKPIDKLTKWLTDKGLKI
jgi:hypothetical protein